MAVIVPELSVTDWRATRAFYTALLGFSVRYERPEEGFCYLEREGAELMLDQIGLGRDFDPGIAETPRPLGRGVNLQIEVSTIAPLLEALAGAGHPLILPPEDRWYRRGDREVGNRQFVVADPDGYLLRFHEDLGTRARR
ncbi:VOC family protein [Gemmobacter lutimaris]|uniref:Bleomycin resistance protein n=1 Tax=Gemmobacter lutimaris TaxID=2306023 RepID=A0A398BTK9_9RHOB|nr:VOC family protein [Gemmobacter lutimaris]RID90623.1 VOC family protein [Gemmobacter lutimaris]